ncbi:Mitochondrial intermediate peptidase [Hondaea fermentalgiana]|uniref:oligopeptidase A n=1 Tax=Hondaea fermentalgiana TaxID=2315210 RepID=A0A2R5GWY0_9STRA|nr:Mitochondrial intermediate peptidase [Hondaea fermentalgiana]|eukprot:GBG33183.1 Mitochondrial intermediate peptidase [Hondaea fermentalgiana]
MVHGARGLSANSSSSSGGGGGEVNALLEQDGVPRFDAFRVEDVAPGVEKCLEDLDKGLADLEQRLTGLDRKATYADVVEAAEKLDAPLGFAWGLVSHMMSVKNSDALRTAHAELLPKVIAVGQKMAQSKALFDALKSIDQDSLDPVQRRIVKKEIEGMERSGIGLPDEERATFNDLKREQSQLATQFSNNVLDATKAFKLKLTEPAQVEGLPESALEGMAEAARREEGSEAATATEGPWIATLDGPTFIAVMRFAKDRDVREKVYRAYISRASAGDVDNTPIIRRILEIRAKTSAMLGFESYAQQSLASKMADSPQAVMDMIHFLNAKSRAPAERELQEVTRFAAENGHEGDLTLWDVPFWSEKQKQELFGFSQEELRPYFPLESVLRGLFQLTERVFDVRIVAADGEVPVWDEAVRFFHLEDRASGNRLASFYLDPYVRTGEKRGGAWMSPAIGRSRVLGQSPVAYLVCNGSPPIGEKPSLMTFSDVETLFHEFGHGLQHMCTTVEHAPAAGISNVEWDAVEIPSQFMENFCYDRATLMAFAKHYETGETLPDALFDKVVAARHHHAALMMLRQLQFAALDMRLHSPEFDASRDDPIALQRSVMQEFAVLDPLPEDRFLCAFEHIMAGGYAAGYYSYKYSEIMSADAFAAFEEAGLDDADALAATGRRFRDTILSLGGGTHPSEVFRSFRGREATADALLRHSGLDDEAQAQHAKL